MTAVLAKTVPDDVLLARLVNQDPGALEAVMAKHREMVFRVCADTLGHGPDADDACQEAFLALAQQTKPVSNLEAWLRRVAARKVADSLRQRRRQRRLTPVEDVPELPVEVAPTLPPDTAGVVAEELGRLPVEDQAVVVGYAIDGETFHQLAVQQRRSVGQVAGRYYRCMVYLRGKLTRRGMTLSVGVLMAVLTRTVSAVVSPRAIRLAVVCLIAAGFGVLRFDEPSVDGAVGGLGGAVEHSAAGDRRPTEPSRQLLDLKLGRRTLLIPQAEYNRCSLDPWTGQILGKPLRYPGEREWNVENIIGPYKRVTQWVAQVPMARAADVTVRYQIVVARDDGTVTNSSCQDMDIYRDGTFYGPIFTQLRKSGDFNSYYEIVVVAQHRDGMVSMPRHIRITRHDGATDCDCPDEFDCSDYSHTATWGPVETQTHSAHQRE